MTKLQIALDDISFDDALILLEKIKSYIDIIEVGTPFMMEYGMMAVRTFKEKFPELKVVHSSIGLIEEHRTPGKEYYHDLVLENTAKSTGIVELLDYLKIDSEEAIAIGNGYDDICMCDVVGTSVAVENANSILKETATYITKSASEDGAAQILEKLILNAKED